MKKLFVILTVFTMSIGIQNCASNKEAITQKATLTNLGKDENGIYIIDTKEFTGVKKEELFKRAESFFVYKYNDANSVIQSKDKESGIIIGKGFFENIDTHNIFTCLHTYSVQHILRVDIKDEKIRIILTLNKVIDNVSCADPNGGPTHYSTNDMNIFDVWNEVQQNTARTETSLMYNANNVCKKTISDLYKHLDGNDQNIYNKNW